MPKRLTWFVVGAAAGASAAAATGRRVRRTVSELTPVRLAHRSGESLRRVGDRVLDAAREGREAMQATERDLRARLGQEPPARYSDAIGAEVVAEVVAEVLAEVLAEVPAEQVQVNSDRSHRVASRRPMSTRGRPLRR
jgi:hypothetical protein